MSKSTYVIIGSGQGGVPLATKLAQEGHDVTIFEREAWGGTCVNTGCIPSKTLLASAHAAARARNAGPLGVYCEVTVDFAAVMARVREAISPDGVRQRLEKAGVRLVEAEAELSKGKLVRGGKVTVDADTIIINTGKSPLLPPIDGLKDTPYLTYKTIWDLQERPDELLIIGAGSTGLELGQAMQRLGSQVQIVEHSERPVDDEEGEVSEALQEALETDGVRFHLSTLAEMVRYEAEGFELRLDSGNILRGDALLVATGRQSNTEALQLERMGIEQDSKGNIIIDEHFRTTAAGIYAIGDVTGQPEFTHVSWEDHRRLLDILQVNGAGRRQGDRVLGYAFFTEPQVGRVGLTLNDAEARGYDARAVTIALSRVARAAATGHDRGFYRLVVNKHDDKILGATLVSPQAAELVHIILAHMEAGSTWQQLECSQHIHPSYAEGMPTLARQLV